MAKSSARPLILLVDDFDDALEIYWEYLTFKGYHVIATSSGAEGIAAALAYQPDLILMDLRMPGTSGTEAMRILRREGSALRKVPIIAFTAHVLEEERRNALAAGFDGFIAKPCLPDALAKAIDLLLSRPVDATVRESHGPGDS